MPLAHSINKNVMTISELRGAQMFTIRKFIDQRNWSVEWKKCAIIRVLF